MINTNKNSDRSKSIYHTIIRTFILMIAADILMAAALLAVNVYLSKNTVPETTGDRIFADLDQLKSENYKKIKLNEYLGKGGYFEILDEDANVIYSSSDKQNDYSERVLNYIPDVDADSDVFAVPFNDKSGTGYILVRLDVQDDNARDNQLNELIVVDGNRNIQYSNTPTDGRRFTKKELQYYLQASDLNASDNYILQKFTYDTNDGNPRVMIIHSPVGTRSLEKKEGKRRVFSIVLFVIGILISAVTAGVLIVNKIRHPLTQLNNAMHTFAKGQYEMVPEDSGISEFDHVLSAFNNMAEQLDESEKQKRILQEQKQRMLADVSHDLKTPITVLKGYIDAMQDGLIEEKDRPKYLQIMADKTALMSELITSFNEYSRLEHPDFHYHLKTGDISEFLREYIISKYEELEIGGYKLDLSIPDEKIMVAYDASQLPRVFENILSNILKYTAPGTTIFVKLFIDNRECVIDMGDNGPGMKEELKEIAFQPFVTGNKARKSGKGTGLGLSIAKKIIEGHHGSIRILTKTEWKQGTMYEIKLPL